MTDIFNGQLNPRTRQPLYQTVDVAGNDRRILRELIDASSDLHRRRRHSPTATAGNSLVLQDTRDWQAVHRGTMNLLMADGSVKTITDLNGDGFLNPGFPIAQAGTDTRDVLSQTVGYVDGTVETPAFSVYNGVLLNSASVKGAFED